MKKSELAALYVTLGEEATTAFLIQVGETPEGAAEKIAAALTEVEAEKQKAELSGITTEVKQVLLDFGDSDIKPLLPVNTKKLEITLCYTSEDMELGTSDSPQAIPAGFYVKGIKIRREGMEKMVSLFSGARHYNAGSGNGTPQVAVPVPKGAPFKSWVKYAQETYNNETLPTGKGKSAPVGLRKVKDVVYLAAQAIKVSDNRQATWEEIEEAITD